MLTPIEPARWRLFLVPEATASEHASAPCYSGPENIRVLATVVSELGLSDIEWEVFPADPVEAVHNPAFEDRPKAFNRNRIGTDRAHDIFTASVPHLAVWIEPPKVRIGVVVVSREQAYFIRDDFANQPNESFHIGALDGTRHDPAAPPSTARR
jgi:hypothetical protein